jgi:hypothetical protein
MKLFKSLHPRSHVRDKPQPVGGVRAFENPDCFVRLGECGVPRRTERLVTTMTLQAYLSRDRFRRHRWLRDRRERAMPIGAKKEPRDGWLTSGLPDRSMGGRCPAHRAKVRRQKESRAKPETLMRGLSPLVGLVAADVLSTELNHVFGR